MHEEKSKTSPSQIRGGKQRLNATRQKRLTLKKQKAQAMLPTGGKIKYNMSTSINKYHQFAFSYDGWSSGNVFVSGSRGPRFKSRSVKLNTVLPIARHRCNISSKEAVLPGFNDAKMGPDNSLYALTSY